MPFTILLTGFGPFPGAPSNPTGPLVELLARRFATGVRRRAHIFPTSYEAVDRDLPLLVARERPAVLLMFGLAMRARRIRIETCARNVLSNAVPDVAGVCPSADAIAPDGPLRQGLRAPALRLAAAARNAGRPAALSSDAGSYLCNYLCWRAAEAAGSAAAAEGLRLFTFIHIPDVRLTLQRQAPPGSIPRTLGDLIPAVEAIVAAATRAARIRR